LRIYPTTFQFDEQGIRRFMRGIPDAGKIRHPNIVRLYRGGFQKKGNGHLWFLAMEYLPGGSLRDRLQHGARLSVPVTIRYAADIAHAVEAATARCLVHRNINPSCILFDAVGTAKLGDFSLMRGGVLQAIQEITVADGPPGEQCIRPRNRSWACSTWVRHATSTAWPPPCMRP
jgi:serine/threonine-protein kinase